MRKLPPKVKRILPWLGSLVLVGYLVLTADKAAIREAAMAADIIPSTIALLVAAVLTFLADTYCVSYMFTRFVCPVTWKEALPIKATSYFLNVLNYNAALAGMALYLKRKRNTGFLRPLGSLVLLNVMDLTALLILMVFGMIINLGSLPLPDELVGILWLVAVGGLAAAGVGILLMKSNLPVPIISRLRTTTLFEPLCRTTLKDWGFMLLCRGSLLVLYLASQKIIFGYFGVNIPWEQMFVYMPVLTFIQIIPITISGLGTTQLAMRNLYGPFAAAGTRSPAAVVDLTSTFMILGFVVIRLVIAYLFLGDLSRDVIRDAGREINNDDPRGDS